MSVGLHQAIYFFKLKISVIIPTLNEENWIRKTILHTWEMACAAEKIEIIVVDAGSTDDTIKKVPEGRILLMQNENLKGEKHASLNLGATKSSNDILLFLDADSKLPDQFDKKIIKALRPDQVVGGAFNLSFDQADLKLKMLSLVNQFRYTTSKEYFGDQCIFCKKETWLNVGGYPNQNIMESASFCNRLRKKGKLVLIKDPVITSSRRFVRHGFWKTLLMDLKIWIKWKVGLNTAGLGKKYWQSNMND